MSLFPEPLRIHKLGDSPAPEPLSVADLLSTPGETALEAQPDRSLLFQAQTSVLSALPQTQPRELTPTCLEAASRQRGLR